VIEIKLLRNDNHYVQMILRHAFPLAAGNNADLSLRRD
jgi:hypothetical protein